MPLSDVIVIVHAGAGRRREQTIQQVSDLCERAAQHGRLVGCSTGDATAAVVEAIRILEESPHTNAGIGSNVNRDCAVECDASLVEGWSQRGGSVGGVPSAANAILIAYRMVTQQGSPACLVGPGALSWFRESGGEMPEMELVTNKQRKMFTKYTAATNSGSDVVSPSLDPSGGNDETDKFDSLPLDTVGAVALVGGRIAAGVSSGGTFLKHPGRVGQAGVYGAGCWADRTAGVSTSGSGEDLIRTMLASRCVAALSKTPGEEMGHDEDGDESPPPAMKLKSFLEEEFIGSPCVLRSPVGGTAAGVAGLVYDEKHHTCDLVWAHTTANFVVGYSAPGTTRDVLRSEVCSQPNAEDTSTMKVYASGTTLRLPVDS